MKSLISRRSSIIAAVAAFVLTLVFIGVFSGMAKAAPPPSADCSSVPATAYCVAVPQHGWDVDDPLAPLHVTRYTIFHEGTTSGKVAAFYMNPISSTSLFTENIGTGLTGVFKPGQYFNKTVESMALFGWSGTTVFSGTIPFSIQNLDPNDTDCPDNVWEGLCNFYVYVPRDTYTYAILNTGSYVISQTHDIYQNGALYATVHHEVAPFTMERFTIPTPTVTPSPEPTPEGATATPTPTQTLAQARAAHAAQASGIGFEVRVTNPTATPTPTATPPPATPKRLYIPLITR